MSSSLDVFPCTGCGSCCRRIGVLLERAKRGQIEDKYTMDAVLRFPYKTVDGDQCEKLMDNGHCEVYENRPDICNTGTVFNNNYGNIMGKQEFFKMTAEVCNRMQEFDKVDEKFRIDVTQF